MFFPCSSPSIAGYAARTPQRSSGLCIMHHPSYLNFDKHPIIFISPGVSKRNSLLRCRGLSIPNTDVRRAWSGTERSAQRFHELFNPRWRLTQQRLTVANPLLETGYWLQHSQTPEAQHSFFPVIFPLALICGADRPFILRLELLRTHSIRPTRWLGGSGLVVDSDHHTVGCVERALENFRDLLPRLPPCLDNTRAGALMLCMVGDLRVHKMCCARPRAMKA